MHMNLIDMNAVLAGPIPERWPHPLAAMSTIDLSDNVLTGDDDVLFMLRRVSFNTGPAALSCGMTTCSS